jgi:hypothetical protein
MRRKIFGLALLAMATLTPVYASADDQEDKEVAQEIATILRDSGRMQNYSVGVKFKDGNVWLAGRVSSKEQMAAALDVVSDIEGVNQIVNNMTVTPAAPAKTARAGKNPNVQLAAAQQAAPIAPAAGAATPVGYRQLPPQQMAMGQIPGGGRPLPAYVPSAGNCPPPAAYDQPNMPNYAWPSYAAAPNYAAVTYPKQYSASAWPYIGPFYPYPQVPLGWRKVSLEWDDGWWFLDFDDRGCH